MLRSISARAGRAWLPARAAVRVCAPLSTPSRPSCLLAPMAGTALQRCSSTDLRVRFLSSSPGVTVTLEKATRIAERYIGNINNRDVESLCSMLAADYHSSQPLHPGRSFTGLEVVRKNHLRLFELYEAIKVELKSVSCNQNEVWLEVHWNLRRDDKDTSPLLWKGVVIFGVKDETDTISWGRLYMEPVTGVMEAKKKKKSLVERLVGEAQEDAQQGYQKMTSIHNTP